MQVVAGRLVWKKSREECIPFSNQFPSVWIRPVGGQTGGWPRLSHENNVSWATEKQGIVRHIITRTEQVVAVRKIRSALLDSTSACSSGHGK